MNIFVYLISQKFQIASLKTFAQILLKSFFSKLRSAELNYHLPKLSSFTDPYCAGGGGGGGGGGSNKHCLLTLTYRSARFGLKPWLKSKFIWQETFSIWLKC